MSANYESLLPPDTPEEFESLCLDLWMELCSDPGAQKNGRRGQNQDGVDVFAQQEGKWTGIQCKRKDGLLRTKVSPAELKEEVTNARKFREPLARFILATTGPRDEKVQALARQLTTKHRAEGLFTVEVWSWEDIREQFTGRRELRKRILQKYYRHLRDDLELEDTEPGSNIVPTRLRHGAEKLVGRETELADLDKAWDDSKTHVVTIVAWGGVGKTALVVDWMARMAADGWRGAERVFDWSFYSQGTKETTAASGDVFVAKALEFFGDPEMAKSAASPWDKGERLARLIGKRRTLLVLDGIEPLQHGPGPVRGKLKDPAIEALLIGLAQRNAGLCLVTTRESLTDLGPFHNTTAPEWQLERLSEEAGAQLLFNSGVRKAGDGNIKADDQELKDAAREVRGHALTLQLLGRYLAKARKGDIRKRSLLAFEKADEKVQGGHAFKVMKAYEIWLGKGGEEGKRQLSVLNLLGLFDRPADAGCIAALRREPAITGLTEPLTGLDDEDWNCTVSSLRECALIADHSDESVLDAHPLVREYFAGQLHATNLNAWREGHLRLYEHLKETSQEFPDTLEGLMPLYEAVAHGCEAGCHMEALRVVFHRRINREPEPYALKQMGAFGPTLGALTCFFDEPWRRVNPALSDPATKGWLFNSAAFVLKALGRLSEAREPMRAAMCCAAGQEDWRNASHVTINLSELELQLGNMPTAVQYGTKAVAFADRGPDRFVHFAAREALANALYMAGQHSRSREYFREAEVIQAKDRPGCRFLFSLGGFWYCRLLLGETERAAWRRHLSLNIEDSQRRTVLASCRAVEERAIQTLKIAMQNNWLLSMAIDHLTLGRAALYRSVLNGSKSEIARRELGAAVEGLRAAGEQTYLPHGLSSRAWFKSVEKDIDASAADLDEAWRIAERGAMRLHQADVLLHRGRLFRDKAALAEARKLIEECGYHRRDGELADAEEAAKGW